MTKVDLRQQFKALYTASSKEAALVDNTSATLSTMFTRLNAFTQLRGI